MHAPDTGRHLVFGATTPRKGILRCSPGLFTDGSRVFAIRERFASALVGKFVMNALGGKIVMNQEFAAKTIGWGGWAKPEPAAGLLRFFLDAVQRSVATEAPGWEELASDPSHAEYAVCLTGALVEDIAQESLNK